ncbi:hypothetical protein Ciccas_004441 [Cichlidogyrus casuarinus]|uniref:Uncharacterized protein n=1 Tax=Cichlidogyrus casuarinus TaxID=1844966 RepID=A0ABD2QBH4_9PLAT
MQTAHRILPSKLGSIFAWQNQVMKARLLEQCKSRSQEAPSSCSVEEPLIMAEQLQPVLRHSSSLQAASESKGSNESLRKCFSEEKLSKQVRLIDRFLIHSFTHSFSQLILKRLGQMKSEPVVDTAASNSDKSPSSSLRSFA